MGSAWFHEAYDCLMFWLLYEAHSVQLLGTGTPCVCAKPRLVATPTAMSALTEATEGGL
jgi:hypothetical protein